MVVVVGFVVLCYCGFWVWIVRVVLNVDLELVGYVVLFLGWLC